MSPSPSRAGAPTSFVRLLALGLLLLQIATVADAGRVARICNFLMCSGKDDDKGGLPARPAGIKDVHCPNPAHPKDKNGWGISKVIRQGKFPTVEQIMEDYKLCGACTDPKIHALFYTFGGGTTASNNFKKADEDDKNSDLNLRLLADCMPQTFVDAAGKIPGMDEPNGAAQVLWIIRNSQAFAKLARGDVYVVTNGKGTTEQKANIFTSPYYNRVHKWMERHNVWYDYEFGALQRNDKVTAIYTVPNHPEPLKADKTGDGAWVRGKPGRKAANFVDGNQVTIASIQKQMHAYNILSDSVKAAHDNDMTCNPGNGVEKRAAAAACPVRPKGKATKTGPKGPRKTKATKTGPKGPRKTKTPTKPGKKPKSRKGNKKTSSRT